MLSRPPQPVDQNHPAARISVEIIARGLAFLLFVSVASAYKNNQKYEDHIAQAAQCKAD